MNSTPLRLLVLLTITVCFVAVASPLLRSTISFDEPVSVALLFAALGFLVAVARHKHG